MRWLGVEANMDFRQLQYILQVAEERSFSKAAKKKLFIAQPSLSQYVQKVEQDLECNCLTGYLRCLAAHYCRRTYTP